MLQAAKNHQEYDYTEALRTGKPRNNFDALLLQVAAIDLNLVDFIAAFAKFFGLDQNLMNEPLTNSAAAHKRLGDIPEIKYDGDPELLKDTARAAIETMEQKGRLAFEDEESRAEFLAEAGKIAEQSLADGKFNHHAFEQSLIVKADQYNINFLKFNDPDPAAVDFSNQVTGTIEFKGGGTVFTPNDGGDPIVFTLDNLDIYDLADSERDKLVMDQVAYVQTAHLPQHFTGEVTLTAVALQDADADASNAEVVAWRLSSDDKNYYIGQDSFVAPDKEWHSALTSGFEENRELDNDNNLRADNRLTQGRLNQLEQQMNAAEASQDHVKLQSLMNKSEELLNKPDPVRDISQPTPFGTTF